MTAKCTGIDLSSSMILLPATHNGWSVFCDVGVAIDERGRRRRRRRRGDLVGIELGGGGGVGKGTSPLFKGKA